MDELAKAGLVDTSVRRVDGMTLGEAIDEYSITSPNVSEKAIRKYSSAAANKFNLVLGSQGMYYKACLLYTSPSPRDVEESRMPSSA